jgi:hypothetical protein
MNETQTLPLTPMSGNETALAEPLGQPFGQGERRT